MNKTFLITGGAGFVGGSIGILLKQRHENCRVFALDNLKRRGSELNLPRLRRHGVEFVHGDVRNREDLECLGRVDCIIDCSAEPSVLAGIHDAPSYVINTNLVGTFNCLELARKYGSEFIFLSTSRVYPIPALEAIPFIEMPTRFEWQPTGEYPGMSERGITETFPLDGPRSLYGATKLCAELLIQEYTATYGVRSVINRCGVITGPWQMGKVDQGFVVHWVAQHYFGGSLAYFGYGGQGKQVRDILHIEDLFELIEIQLLQMERPTGAIYNVGGGAEVSVSLCELTGLCVDLVGKRLPISLTSEVRKGDVRIYISDYTKVHSVTGWKPKHTVTAIVNDIVTWLRANERELRPVLA